MTRLSTLSIITSLLLISAAAVAKGPANEPDRSVFISLVEDVAHEVMTMDAVTESQDERARFAENFRSFVANPLLPNPTLESQKSWSGLWPDYEVGPDFQSRRSHTRVDILPKSVDRRRHSLKDMRLYVEQRLGAATCRTLESKSVAAVIYGGELSSALADLNVDPKSAIRVPSFYERWGLSKLFVPGTQFPDARPRLIIAVPPSVQYLEHYATMMAAIGLQAEHVRLDQNDQRDYRESLKSSVSQMARQLGAKPDFTVFGYYDQWLSVLSSETSKWKILEKSSEISGKLGLSSRRLKIENLETQEITELFLVKSGLAVWGQSAAFVAEGLLELKPRGLLFLGSAGALDRSHAIYGLSVPKRFTTKSGTLRSENFVNRVRLESPSPVRIAFDSTHGHTFSPIEQDSEFLSRLRGLGIGTVDVEQSLIAKAVERFNRAHQAHVRFGAINLITDRPGDFLDGVHADHDLDRVDYKQKQLARETAVALALKAISQPSPGAQCRDLFRSSMP